MSVGAVADTCRAYGKVSHKVMAPGIFLAQFDSSLMWRPQSKASRQTQCVDLTLILGLCCAVCNGSIRLGGKDAV